MILVGVPVPRPGGRGDLGPVRQRSERRSLVRGLEPLLTKGLMSGGETFEICVVTPVYLMFSGKGKGNLCNLLHCKVVMVFHVT